MTSSRHDVYIVQDHEGHYWVRPGTIAVSPCTCAIRFRNMAGQAATLDLPDSVFRPAHLELAPLASGTVLVNWAVAEARIYPYQVQVLRQRATGNSDPSIIIDL